MQLVKKLFSSEIEQVKEEVKLSLKSNIFLLNMVINYLVRQKGKMVRPYFVLLSAKLFGEVNHSTILAASSIELLHTATLIHDDVVDNSDTRRGFFSIPNVWKNKVSVLAGDYLLSKGLLILLDKKEFEILTSISEATKKMSEGELLQLEKRRFSSISEQDYLNIIYGKTTSLIESCFEVGAFSVLKSQEKKQTITQLGHSIGMAFQIKDDLLDFETSSTDKPKGQDLRQNNMTLPLIYSMKRASFFEKRKIKSLMRRKSINSEIVNKVYRFCEEKGGIDYATNKMKQYADKAKKMASQFPPSSAQKALTELIDYTINRKK